MSSKTVLLSTLLGALLLSMPVAKQFTFTDVGYDMKDITSLVPSIINTEAKVSDSELISKTPVPIFTKIKRSKSKRIPVITLTSGNMLILRGPVTSASINKLKYQLLKKSINLPKSAHIYLVLDTPGGSVDAGLDFIDVVKAVPQKVHTITLFAASMGFQIAQNLNNRYITPTGTLMSHRAKIGGIGGELPGELIVRLNHALIGLKRMDKIAAKRVGMTLKNYRELIRDEYWVDGFKAVSHKMADRQILVKCSKSLINGTEQVSIRSFFGTVKLKFSKCPLLRSPLDTSYNFKRTNTKQQTVDLRKFSEDFYTNRRKYVEEYIKTNKFMSFVK